MKSARDPVGSNGRAHPSDLLPEFVHGMLDEATHAMVAAHLETCVRCAEEARIQTALAGGDVPGLTRIERERLYRKIMASRPRPARWRGRVWKVAAAVAALLTGVGVWQARRASEPATSRWSDVAALQAWEDAVRELAPDTEAIQLALAYVAPGDDDNGTESSFLFGTDLSADGSWSDADTGAASGTAVSAETAGVVTPWRGRE